jgi:hypothetical protein
MNEKQEEAWASIEKYLIDLAFDGTPESSDAPWFATSSIDGLYEAVGRGMTPLDAVENFMFKLKSMRKQNDKTHGVNPQ